MNSSSRDAGETDIWMFSQNRAVTQLSARAKRGRERDHLLAEGSLRSFGPTCLPASSRQLERGDWSVAFLVPS